MALGTASSYRPSGRWPEPVTVDSLAADASPSQWPADYWLDRPGEEALSELDGVIARARQLDDEATLVQALVWQGNVRGCLGRIDAESVLQEAVAGAVRLRDEELRCRALLALARVDQDNGRHASALAGCRLVSDLARDAGSLALVRQALSTSATSFCHLGEHDLAVETFEEARMMSRGEPGALEDHDRQVALGRYATGQAQAWLMRGGLLLEASGQEAAADALARARVLGEHACEALLQASPRFSHAALFGLVRVLLESGEVSEARVWMRRISLRRPSVPPTDSLAHAQWRLCEAMIDIRARDSDPLQVLHRLKEVDGVSHPRVTGGDLRLAQLRCLFEAHEQAELFEQALAFQRQWSQAKARLRTQLALEHGLWTTQTLAGLRAEADEFVTDVLCAPLRVAAAALEERQVSESLEEVALISMRRAGHSVRRALDIADQYLGVMRAEHFRREDLQPLDLSAVVDDVSEQMAPPTNAEVGLECEIERPVSIRGDRVLLMRALSNLLSNAFKHAPAGSVVRIALKVSDGAVWLSVADQGPGMSLDMRARLFQRFATGAVRKGNGLGLAMVARAARVHQARIEVDSEMGRGTTVSLILGVAGDGP